MAILPIVLLNNPVLRQKAKRVQSIDASIQKLIDDMIDTLHDANGVGLAAPQVGVPLRIAVIHLPDEEEIITLINPEIVRKSGEREVEEGCLSIPGYRARIKRAEKVTAKARDRTGSEFRIKGEELLAQALEHEIDHINGTLYIDYLESLDQLYKIPPAATPEEAPAR